MTPAQTQTPTSMPAYWSFPLPRAPPVPLSHRCPQRAERTSGTVQRPSSRPGPTRTPLGAAQVCTAPARGEWPQRSTWDTGTHPRLRVSSEAPAFSSSSSFTVLEVSASSQASLLGSKRYQTTLPLPARRPGQGRGWGSTGDPTSAAGDPTFAAGAPHGRLCAHALPVSVDGHPNHPRTLKNEGYRMGGSVSFGLGHGTSIR